MSSSYNSLFYGVAVGVAILDQLTKYVVVHWLKDTTLPLIPSVFHLTYVQNTGVAFGLLSKYYRVPILMLSCAMIVVIMCAKESFIGQRVSHACAWGLILGGAVGNLIDRLRFAYVIDFLDFRVWPVFNIADTCISTGVVLLALCTLFFSKKDF